MTDRQEAAALCFDIGGANLKAFHWHGEAVSVAFPMWIRPHSLADEIRSIADRLPPTRRWGVTMTGEMADVFIDRAEGVKTIVEQVMAAAATMGIDDVGFYATAGQLVSAAQAITEPTRVASANWHALAKWVSTWIQRPGLLVDIGTTTTDLIPVSPGRVDTTSRTDFDRLARGELVYLGVSRTPICAIVAELPFAETMIPIIRESFANTDDCALLLGWVPEDQHSTDTCDGRSREMKHATNRIARMIGLGHHEVSVDQARLMAAHVMHRASQMISQAAHRHANHVSSEWIISGHAERLISVAPTAQAVFLSNQLGTSCSRVGPAYALYKLMENDMTGTHPCR